MALQTTTLNPESNVMLDKSLLSLPYELLRKNFKSAQELIERDMAYLLSAMKEFTPTGNMGPPASVNPSQKACQLDKIITRMQGLKRKLEVLRKEEKGILEHSKRRITHLQELHDAPSLVDEGYDQWGRVCLDRLLVDYLSRNGYEKSAKQLAGDLGIEDLVDVNVFVHCARIEASLRKGSVVECLVWCAENKNQLRNIKSNLEFELRLQQFIELARSGNKREAISHSKKFLAVHQNTHLSDIVMAAGLLAYPPSTRFKPYKDLYSPNRWEYLSQFFVNTHYNIHSLPSCPPLRIALSAGLSSLKTSACHSSGASSSVASSSKTTASSGSHCPTCSTELSPLAEHVPHANYSRSLIDPDPVVLPNGRIYGKSRLEEISAKAGMPQHRVMDPTTGGVYDKCRLREVYIS